MLKYKIGQFIVDFVMDAFLRHHSFKWKRSQWAIRGNDQVDTRRNFLQELIQQMVVQVPRCLKEGFKLFHILKVFNIGQQTLSIILHRILNRICNRNHLKSHGVFCDQQTINRSFTPQEFEQHGVLFV